MHIYIYTYIDIANIFRDICIVIVCDSAQLLVSHDFIVVTPKKMQNRFNLSIKFWIWFYSNFHLFGGLLYIHKSLSEDTKNIPSKVLECPPLVINTEGSRMKKNHCSTSGPASIVEPWKLL